MPLPESFTALWQGQPGLEWTQYDDSDDWVVHNPASANIQLVTASTHRLWTLLATEGPKTTAALATAFSGEGAQALDEDYLRNTETALNLMDQAGLVRRVRL
jgi:hypothetical protein